jgi:hypothetical protein
MGKEARLSQFLFFLCFLKTPVPFASLYIEPRVVVVVVVVCPVQFDFTRHLFRFGDVSSSLNKRETTHTNTNST